MTFRAPGRVRLYACIAAANHGTTLQRVLSSARARPEVMARREVMRRLDADSFRCGQIARWLHLHHCTVLYGLGRVSKRGKRVTEKGLPA